MSMTMTQEQLDSAIANRSHEKVTKEGIEARIAKTDYLVLPNSTVTLCNIVLDNGYSVRGESACVDARNFNMEIGQNLAYKDAFAKLWALEGYLLAERRFRAA
jgi:hypothetical protein